MQSILCSDVIEHIFSFTNIQCHSCIMNISEKTIKNMLKVNKYYYCNEICYLTVGNIAH